MKSAENMFGKKAPETQWRNIKLKVSNQPSETVENKGMKNAIWGGVPFTKVVRILS